MSESAVAHARDYDWSSICERFESVLYEAAGRSPAAAESVPAGGRSVKEAR